MLWYNFIGEGKIEVNGLPCLNVIRPSILTIRIAVFSVSQVMDPGRHGPSGSDEQGNRPVRVEGEEIATWVELSVTILLAGWQYHLEITSIPHLPPRRISLFD